MTHSSFDSNVSTNNKFSDVRKTSSSLRPLANIILLSVLGMVNAITASANTPAPSARINVTQQVISVVQPNANGSANTVTQASSAQSTRQSSTINTALASASVSALPIQILTGLNLSATPLSQIPTPLVSVSNLDVIRTVVIPRTTNPQDGNIDVSTLDDFIASISPNARHHPPRFINATQRYNATNTLTQMEAWLRPFAEAPNASFDVLLRAAKLNGMARNLDMGSAYALRGSQFITRAIALQPNNAEANFLYGMMLAEGGAFPEGNKYLQTAANMGYLEAEQSLAQSDLMNDKKDAALSRLRRLQAQHPNNQEIAQQIAILESGKFYLWDLPLKR